MTNEMPTLPKKELTEQEKDYVFEATVVLVCIILGGIFCLLVIWGAK